MKMLVITVLILWLMCAIANKPTVDEYEDLE